MQAGRAVTGGSLAGTGLHATGIELTVTAEHCRPSVGLVARSLDTCTSCVTGSGVKSARGVPGARFIDELASGLIF